MMKQLGQVLKETGLAWDGQGVVRQRLGLTRQSHSRLEKGLPQTLSE